MLFPRAEIAMSEVLMFEVANEAGIFSDGDLVAVGSSAAAAVGAAVSSSDMSSASAAAWSAVAGAMAQAALSSLGSSAVNLPASSLVQGSLTSAGESDSAFGGVVFMKNLQLGTDPMGRTAEQRDMVRYSEGRGMVNPADEPITRATESRGMTK